MIRKAIAFLLLGCLPSFAWDVGFDFRATQGYVTDPAYATFASNATYPTTLSVNGQQITFGWESQGSGYLTRDRNASADPRLAGVACQANSGITSVFRVDLPSAGTYSIAMAAGDGFGFDEYNHFAISSANTTLFSVVADTAANFADAAGTIWGISAWPGSNVGVRKTFANTILRLTLGGATDSAYSCVAHLRVTSVQAVAPGGTGWSFFIL